MKIYKMIAILLIILSTLASCDSAVSNNVSKPPVSNADCLVYEGEVIYAVIRSDISSRAVTDAAVALRKFINENLPEGEVKILTDWVKKNEVIEEVRGTYEILVGQTNRPESIESYEKFRKSEQPLEYMIEKSGNHYIILGSDETIMGAVEAFIENITVYNEGKTLKVTEDINLSAFKQFPVSLLTIDDVTVSNFTIVYPAAYNESQRQLAQSVKEYIYIATGFDLDMVSDREAKSDYEILIGTSRGNTYSNLNEMDCTIEIRDGNLHIGGKNYYADAKAVNYLINDVLYFNMYGKNPTKIELTSSDSKVYESKPYTYDIIA